MPAGFTIALRPRDERARQRRRPSSTGCKQRGGADPRHDGLFPAGAGHPDQHAVEPRAVPVHADRHRRRRSRRLGAEAGATSCGAIADAARRRLGGAGRRAAACRSRSTARRPAGSACRCRRSTTRSTTPSASARSRPSTAQANQYRVILEAKPRYQQDPAALAQALRAGSSTSTGTGGDGRQHAAGTTNSNTSSTPNASRHRAGAAVDLRRDRRASPRR